MKISKQQAARNALEALISDANFRIRDCQAVLAFLKGFNGAVANERRTEVVGKISSYQIQLSRLAVIAEALS